jgi:leucyl aminopeptidase
MNTIIKTVDSQLENSNLVLVVNNVQDIPISLVTKKELEFIKQQLENKKEVVALNHFPNWTYILISKEEENNTKQWEKCRQNGTKIIEQANDQKLDNLCLIDYTNDKNLFIAVVEGMALANYQFIKYFTKETENKKHTVAEIKLVNNNINKNDLKELNAVLKGNAAARTFVNEPVVYLNAEKFSSEMTKLFFDTKAEIEVLNKKQIESLKMGGLLAVNKGSIDPPTFNIITWKPENAVNEKPYVFVGKGVVFDTGGLNIKTGDFMSDMKCDMAGGAAVAGAIYAIAKAELPVHIIGLIPATDNRPNGNAHVPDDIITMYDGTTVEIKNTDAEGRLILADALAYAKKYDPKLVIDLATLTGAAHRAIGHHGIVAMGIEKESEFTLLEKSGNDVYERLAIFPFWDEYAEEIKSPVADIKNLGGPSAGMITAGKFLEHFTDYPYIHLDIAGPAFLDKKSHYRPQGGTGVGVRLLFNFIKQKVNS